MSRYYVIGVTGQAVIPVKGRARGFWGTSYSVLDSAHNHREVFTRYAGLDAGWGASRASGRRLIQCELEAARLNRLDAA